MSEKPIPAQGPTPAPVAEETCIHLEVCPRCECSLVQPTDWTHIGRERWKVELYCPGCEWRGSGVHEQDTVDRYDDFLDAAMQQVLDDLQLLTKANMENGAQRFLSALDAGLILPEDF
jgi:hypothetical protein